MIELHPEILTRDNFEPFGEVIDISESQHFSINNGAIERFHDLATISIDYADGGRPLINLFQSNVALSLPAKVRLVERHPRGSQAFIPLFNEPMLIVVAPLGETVDVKLLHAFISNGFQGINYHPGIWHMPLISTKAGEKWLVVDRGGPGNNCDEFYFENDEIILLS